MPAQVTAKNLRQAEVEALAVNAEDSNFFLRFSTCTNPEVVLSNNKMSRQTFCVYTALGKVVLR